MPDRVWLAEFPGDVDRFAPQAGSRDRWMAVTPTALDELAVRGMPALLDEEIVAPEDLNRIGRSNFTLADTLVERYDQLVLRRYPKLERIGMRPFRGHFHRIKLFLDAVTSRLQVLQALSGGGAVAFGKVRSPRSGSPCDTNLFYTAEASLYDDLLRLLDEQRRADVLWVPGEAPPGRRSRLEWDARQAKNALRVIAQRAAGCFRARRGAPRLLVLGLGYDLRRILHACRRWGVEAFWLDLSRRELRRWPWLERCQVHDVSEMAELESALRCALFTATEDPAEDLCRVNGFSYAGVIRPALTHYVREGVPEAVALHAFLDAAHRQFRFDLVLSPAGPERITTRTVFDFFRRAHVPVAVMQHGAYGYAENPITNYYEFGFDGDFLAWGTGVEAQYEPTKRGAVRFVPVGSPSLEQIVARRHRTASKPDRIMYITTDLRGSSAYFPGGQPWLDTSYYRFQQAVLKVLGAYQDRYDLWLKVPPAEEHLAWNPIRGWLQANALRVAVESRPLVRVIDEPALFLIDFPSTTLLQCLGTRAELIVFTGSPYFTVLPPARALLEQRAICCDSPQAFLHAVERACAHGVRPRDVVDDGFLSRYGTLLHDGGSLERIRGYLQERGLVDPGRAAATPARAVWQAP